MVKSSKGWAVKISWPFPKGGARKGWAVTTDWSFLKGRASEGQSVTIPYPFTKGGARGGRAVTTPELFPNGRARGGQTLTNPSLFLMRKTEGKQWQLFSSSLKQGRGMQVYNDFFCEQQLSLLVEAIKKWEWYFCSARIYFYRENIKLPFFGQFWQLMANSDAIYAPFMLDTGPLE